METGPHPFAKIREAKEQSAEVKYEASREANVLNPKGLGGPIFDEMIQMFQTLGTDQEYGTQVERIRNLAIATVKRRSKSLYNEYLEGRKGSIRHEEFEDLVESSFTHGFSLYLKVMLRIDAGKAPKPHAGRRVTMYGKGVRVVKDQHNEEYYVRQYLTKGDEVFDGNQKEHEEHKFTPNPDQTFIGYADKYQQIDENNSEFSALASYMFEKYRLFEDDYFSMLEEALDRKLPYKTALDLAEYSYGNEASLFSEMNERGLPDRVIAQVALNQRARVRVPFETYLAIGGQMEEKYPFNPDDTSSWVTSPHLIRNLILKFPLTAEQGIPVASQCISDLRKSYPEISRKFLVEKCVASPGSYEESIRIFVEQAKVLAGKFRVTPDIEPQYVGDDDVFSYFKLSGEVVSFMERNSVAKYEGELKRIVGEFVWHLKQLNVRAARDGQVVAYSEKRRLLRSLMSTHASRQHINNRFTKIIERRINRTNDLYDKAEDMSPVWGRYYAELGFGKSTSEKLETGEVGVGLVVDQFGSYDGELELERRLDLLYKYVDQGFENGGDLEKLKDALILSPYAPKEFYCDVLDGVWPGHVIELVEDDEDIEK